MGKGNPKRKPSQSHPKGNSTQEDRRTKDDKSEIHVVTDRKQVGVVANEVNEIANENHVGSVGSKKYARRKIESNWSRYEENEVDKLQVEAEKDYDETKDFDYIRQSSASASSLFKFKEERGWEKELEINNEGNNVFGLDLVELAASLQIYGVGKKLGLLDLIHEECKYCVTDIIGFHLESGASSSPKEMINTSHKMKWSYDGMEKYKYLFGLTPEDGQVQRGKNIVEKSSPCNTETQVEYEHEIVKKLSNVPQKSMGLHRSTNNRSDCDILDQLLIDRTSFNEPNKWLVDCEDNELIKCNENDKEQSPSRASNEENELLPILDNDGSTSGNKMSDEELDLDMLLECDLLPSDSENKDGEVDADLDQWLDDMLI